MTCVEPDHFHNEDGSISPQPWMQYRQLATAVASSKAGSFPVAGGGAKNVALQSLQLTWTNTSPVDQLVYGLVTRGGAQVTLQGRSRAYLVARHGLGVGSSLPELTEASRFGGGIDVGSGGTFGSNTAFGVIEHRQPSHTMPLVPDRAGWMVVTAGATVTAGFTLSFISDFWETQAVDGGEDGSESSYVSGDTRLDLFGVPVL